MFIDENLCLLKLMNVSLWNISLYKIDFFTNLLVNQAMGNGIRPLLIQPKTIEQWHVSKCILVVLISRGPVRKIATIGE